MNVVQESESLFRMHFIGWRYLGLLPTDKYRRFYISYSILINIFITVAYPLHLMIGLFQSSNLYEIINNLGINLISWVCSMKMIFVWLKFKNIHIIMDIQKRQNQRICLAKDEVEFYKINILEKARLILPVFIKLYSSCPIFCEITVLLNGFKGNWDLHFPAYFPFDPFASTKIYILAHLYQLFGFFFQTLQVVVNDTFTTMHLNFLSGQIQALNLRVAKLGRDQNKTKADNNRELIKCIEDHRDLLRYRRKLEELIHFFMFCQILITSINMCTVVVIVVFYDADISAIAYYLFYFLAITLQILPICYFGTIVEIEFDKLTQALFASNWLDQDETFKKNLCVFIENTKKPLCIKAWLFPINLNLFLSTCKNAYSLFALIMNIK